MPGRSSGRPHPHQQLALLTALALIVIWGANFTLQKHLLALMGPGGLSLIHI